MPPRKVVDLSLSDPRDLRFQPLNVLWGGPLVVDTKLKQRRKEEKLRKELEAKHEENLQKLVQARLDEIKKAAAEAEPPPPETAPEPPAPEAPAAEAPAPDASAPEAIEAPPPANPEATPEDTEKMPYAVLTLKGLPDGLGTANIQLNFKDPAENMAMVPVVEAPPAEAAETVTMIPQLVQIKAKKKTKEKDRHSRSSKSHSLGVKKHSKSSRRKHRSRSKHGRHERHGSRGRSRSRSRSKTKNEEEHRHRRGFSSSRGRSKSRDASCSSCGDHEDLESDISKLARRLDRFRSRRKSSTHVAIDSDVGSGDGSASECDSECSSCASSSSTEAERGHRHHGRHGHHNHRVTRRGRVARRERHLSSVRCSSCGRGAQVYSDMDDDGHGNCEFRIHGSRGKKKRSHNNVNAGDAMENGNQDGTGSDNKAGDENNEILPALPPIGGMDGGSPSQANGWHNSHQSQNGTGPNTLLARIPSPDMMGGWEQSFTDPVYGKHNHRHPGYPAYAPPPPPQHAYHASYSPPRPYEAYHHPYHHAPSHHHGYAPPYPYAYPPPPPPHPPYVPNPPHSYGPPLSPTGGYEQPSAYAHYGGPPPWAMNASPPAPPALRSSPTRHRGKSGRNNGSGEYNSRSPPEPKSKFSPQGKGSKSPKNDNDDNNSNKSNSSDKSNQSNQSNQSNKSDKSNKSKSSDKDKSQDTDDIWAGGDNNANKGWDGNGNEEDGSGNTNSNDSWAGGGGWGDDGDTANDDDSKDSQPKDKNVWVPPKDAIMSDKKSVSWGKVEMHSDPGSYSTSTGDKASSDRNSQSNDGTGSYDSNDSSGSSINYKDPWESIRKQENASIDKNSSSSSSSNPGGSYPGYSPLNGKVWTQRNIALVRRWNAELSSDALGGRDRWTELQHRLFTKTSYVVTREAVAHYAAGLDISGSGDGGGSGDGDGGGSGSGGGNGRGKKRSSKNKQAEAEPEPEPMPEPEPVNNNVSW